MSDFNRTERVQSELIAVLSEVLQTGVKDPRVGRVSLTGMRLSKDLKVARIRFLPFGGIGDPSTVQEGLQAASGYLRRQVGQRMRIRNVPELIFEADTDFEDAIEVTRIIEEIRGEE